MSKTNCWQAGCSDLVSCFGSHTKLSLVLQELCCLQGVLSSNVSTYVSTGRMGWSAQAAEEFWQTETLSLKKHGCQSTENTSTKWSKTGCGTGQVSSMCHLHSSRDVKLLACNDNNCPKFNTYFYSSYLSFSWRVSGWKQRHCTVVWWGILQWEHVPGLQLDPRSPLIAPQQFCDKLCLTNIQSSGPRNRCWFLFILEPSSEQQAVEIGSSCTVKVMLVG